MQVTLCVSIKPAKDGYTCSIWITYAFHDPFCPASLTVLIPSPSFSSNCPLLPLAVCSVSSLQWCPLSSFQGSCPSTANWAPGSLSSIQSQQEWNLQIHIQRIAVIGMCLFLPSNMHNKPNAEVLLKTDIRFNQKVKVLNCKRFGNVKFGYSNPHQILAISYPSLPSSLTLIQMSCVLKLRQDLSINVNKMSGSNLK